LSGELSAPPVGAEKLNELGLAVELDTRNPRAPFHVMIESGWKRVSMTLVAGRKSKLGATCIFHLANGARRNKYKARFGFHQLVAQQVDKVVLG
jgi:hypothetical protein